jgi:hypothetical protein
VAGAIVNSKPGGSSGGGAGKSGSSPGPLKVPKPGTGGKIGSTDIPSWAKGQVRRVGESGKDFARRVMRERYADQKDIDTSPGSEFSQLKKYADRHFQDP